MSSFNALRIHQVENAALARFDTLSLDELTAGDVVIRVAYSGINYKDALGVSGTSMVVRRPPKVAGIDLSGVVESSSDEAFKPGDKVLVTGCSIGETLDGGFAEFARVPAAAVVPLPESLSLFEAMALGTAGFTAAMALDRLLVNGQRPEHGPIAVTGPTGGVGVIALGLLKRAGFTTAAITGKQSAAEFLHRVGADAVIDRLTLDQGSKFLEKTVWGGAIDNLGGTTLAYLMKTVKPYGNIACIGLAESQTLETTVLPLILRGVSLLGVYSVEIPRAWREAIWNKLAGAWKLPDLQQSIVREVIGLADVPRACAELMAGRALGRYVVRIGGDL